MEEFIKYFKLIKIKVNHWVEKNNFRIILFNMVVVFLFLLRSAGYFHPYFEISVNFIVLASIVLSILLLKAKARAIFFVALTFWLFAGLMKVLKINVWAERTAIYTYQALVVATILLVYEAIASSGAKKGK